MQVRARYQLMDSISQLKVHSEDFHFHVFQRPRNIDYNIFYCFKLMHSRTKRRKKKFSQPGKCTWQKLLGNISSRSGMMRKSLENAQKRNNYLAFVFAARAAGRGAGPSSWLRREERERRKEKFLSASLNFLLPAARRRSCC